MLTVNTAYKFEGSCYCTHLTYCQEDLTRYPLSVSAHSRTVHPACPSLQPTAACRRICSPAWSKISFRSILRKYYLKSTAVQLRFSLTGSVIRRREESKKKRADEKRCESRVMLERRRALTECLLIRRGGIFF